MLDSSRVFNLIKILVSLAVFGWTLSFFGFSTSYQQVLRHFQGEKALFLAEYLQNEIGGQFDGQSIAALCANRTWTKGLIFNCDPPPGGIGEVRNAHLNCIRLAMEAGGMSCQSHRHICASGCRLTSRMASRIGLSRNRSTEREGHCSRRAWVKGHPARRCTGLLVRQAAFELDPVNILSTDEVTLVNRRLLRHSDGQPSFRLSDRPWVESGA